jgi:L-ascorbate metabolism protein UlaG (beta-lactamase superfamily)
MRLRLIRNATLAVQVSGRYVLVDPMLDAMGARPPVADTPNPRRNPLVELPEPAEVVAQGVDALVVTHLHQDHLDETAVRLLRGPTPVLCQPPDAGTLREQGFTAVLPVEDAVEWEGVRVTRTGGRHGTGELGEALGPVSGFVLDAPGEPTLYVAGDTIWCDEVREAIDAHRPDVIVVNASGARFNTGDPIVMDNDDVAALARETTAQIIAVHFETVSHSTETRADLRERLTQEGLTERVSVPEDGSEVPLP